MQKGFNKILYFVTIFRYFMSVVNISFKYKQDVSFFRKVIPQVEDFAEKYCNKKS